MASVSQLVNAKFSGAPGSVLGGCVEHNNKLSLLAYSSFRESSAVRVTATVFGVGGIHRSGLPANRDNRFIAFPGYTASVESGQRHCKVGMDAALVFVRRKLYVRVT